MTLLVIILILTGMGLLAYHHFLKKKVSVVENVLITFSINGDMTQTYQSFPAPELTWVIEGTTYTLTAYSPNHTYTGDGNGSISGDLTDMSELNLTLQNLISILDLSAWIRNGASDTTVVKIGSNAVTEVVMPTIAGYCEFWLDNNNLTTLDLNNFPKVTRIFLQGNSNFTTLLLPASLPELYQLWLHDTPIGYIDLTGCSKMFNNNPTSITLNKTGLTAAEVNHYLVDFDSMAPGGYAGCSINLSTNAAPDSTSGGYDGLAAKASLIAKGITVNTA